LIIGLLFIFVSAFIYIFENYDLEIEHGLKVLKKKENVVKDRFYRYKILVSILALILGIFRIISWIIY